MQLYSFSIRMERYHHTDDDDDGYNGPTMEWGSDTNRYLQLGVVPIISKQPLRFLLFFSGPTSVDPNSSIALSLHFFAPLPTRDSLKPCQSTDYDDRRNDGKKSTMTPGLIVRGWFAWLVFARIGVGKAAADDGGE